MGEPLRDIVPPKTQIELDGKVSRNGQFYDTVTVTLKSDDPSGIDRIEYSLDGGDTWLVYRDPFSVEPGETPQIVLREVEMWGGLPGVNLVLASTTDKAGNVEMPPAHMIFSINPEENPLFVNPAGANACSVQSKIVLDATCRSAPGADSINISTYPSGTSAMLVARNLESTWFMIARPDLPRGACWISRQFVEPSNEVACLSVIGIISDAPPKDESMTALNIPVTGPTPTPPPIPNLTPSPTAPPLHVSPSPTPPSIRGSATATPPAIRLSPTATPPRLFVSPTATAPDLEIDPTNTPPPPVNPPTATPPPP
jgi:hypothetical protein